MEIYFNRKLHAFPDCYAGIEDLPGLALSVHLHSWVFENHVTQGEARLRVEIREGDTDPARPMVGVAFVNVTRESISACQGQTPLSQAIIDGIMTHPEIRTFFHHAAEEALKLPE
jgi:hypothetical protein